MTDGLLIGGVALGILIALAGLVDVGDAPLDEATAATVNETPISTDEFQSLLERRAQGGVPVEELLDTLDIMIDEELLIQRASELGILRRDSNVRIAIIQAMEKSILNEERGRTFADEEVERFYLENTELFSEPLSLQLEELVLPRGSERVDSIAAALESGTSGRALAADSSEIGLTRLPPVPLSIDALARRLPEQIVSQLETAVENTVLRYESARGIHLLRVVSVREARTPPFNEIRLSVLNELQIQSQDVAYREYLEWLRERATIRKNERLAP